MVLLLCKYYNFNIIENIIIIYVGQSTLIKYNYLISLEKLFWHDSWLIFRTGASIGFLMTTLTYKSYKATASKPVLSNGS